MAVWQRLCTVHSTGLFSQRGEAEAESSMPGSGTCMLEAESAISAKRHMYLKLIVHA